MKRIITILLTILTISAFSQTLKTFNGQFAAGTAVYTYYEDPNTREYVKHGTFKYTLNGKGYYQGLNQTITGNFLNGLKNGTWTYLITMDNYLKKDENKYYQGKITLTSNYKNGYADGNWKEIASYMTKYRYENWNQVQTMTIDMNFKNGYIVGAVYINNGFDFGYEVIGNYNNNGFATGTWKIKEGIGGGMLELIYKDNFLYESITRKRTGEIISGPDRDQENYEKLVKAKSMSLSERDEAGLFIDTLCGERCTATYKIEEYFHKLLNDERFLYTYIGGDMTFKEGIKGGCEIKVIQKYYIPLSENEYFKNAEYYHDKGDFLNAYNFYFKINMDSIRPSEREIVNNRIKEISPNIGPLIEKYRNYINFFNKYIPLLQDSISADFDSIQEYLKIKNEKKFFRYPWDEMNAKLALQNLEENKEFYEPYQIAIMESYFEFINVIENEIDAINNSNLIRIHFNDSIYTFNTYDKQIFLENISHAAPIKENYNKAKIMMNLALKFNKNIEQFVMIKEENEKGKESLFGDIQLLNVDINSKKKTLEEKIDIVLSDYQNKYNSYKNYPHISIDECNNILIEANSFIEKAILLYSTDKKNLEKKLKKAETIEQIKAIIID